MRFLLTALLSLASLDVAVGADRLDADPVQSLAAVLIAYQALSEAHAPAFYDLYADEARIEVRVSGRPGVMVFNGAAFKRWGKELAARHQAYPDASHFEAMSLERRGERFLVRAQRQSLCHCSLDGDYRVTLAPAGAAYHIIEEHLTLNPGGTCPSKHPDLNAPLLPAASPRVAWRPLSSDDIQARALKMAQPSPTRGLQELPAPVAPAKADAGTQSKAPAVPSALWVAPRE